MTEPTYYIIEHPTRGTFAYWEDGPHFSWSGSRNDPEKACRFASAQAAQRQINQFPTKIARQCQVLTSAATGGGPFGPQQFLPVVPEDQEPEILTITLELPYMVGGKTPNEIMYAAHHPEARRKLRKLINSGSYDVTWEGHPG